MKERKKTCRKEYETQSKKKKKIVWSYPFITISPSVYSDPEG